MIVKLYILLNAEEHWSSNMCLVDCGYTLEPPQGYTQSMFWIKNKKKIYIIRQIGHCMGVSSRIRYCVCLPLIKVKAKDIQFKD